MAYEEEVPQWSIPKIIIGVIVISVVGWYVYQNQSLIASMTGSSSRDVAGAKIEAKVTPSQKVAIPKFDIQEKIADITSQINNLDVQEVAQSSPQVQKVLKDMESLKDLPKSQAKEACMKICGGL